MDTDIEPVTHGTVDDALAVLDAEARQELAVLEADAELAQSRNNNPADPYGWLPEWFLLQQHTLDQAVALIKEQTRVMLSQVEARRKSLEWRWGREFRVQVDKDIREQHGKKKSVDYRTGRAGYRTAGGKPQLVVEDEEAATAFAAMNVPDAVKTTIARKSDLLDYIESGHGEIPGCRVETPPKHDTFYAGKHALDVPVMDVPQPMPLLENSDGRESN